MEGSKLLINEPPLQVLPTLARILDVNKAIILQQVQYWIATSGHEINGEVWIYNSYAEWSRQFPWLTPRGVRWHIKGLEEAGYLIAGDFNKDPRDHTKWYRVNYEKLEALPKASRGMSQSVTPPVIERPVQVTATVASVPETTSETTTIETTKKAESFLQYQDKLKKRFPELDFDFEFEKFRLYWMDGSRKLKNPKLALLNWMNKAEEYRKERGNGAHRTDSQEDRSARRAASIGAPLTGKRI